MNRAERRAHEKSKHPVLPANQVRLTTDYGHNGVQVMIRFSQPVQNLFMFPDEAEKMIGYIRGSIQRLAEHKAGVQAAVKADRGDGGQG